MFWAFGEDTFQTTVWLYTLISILIIIFQLLNCSYFYPGVLFYFPALLPIQPGGDGGGCMREQLCFSCPLGLNHDSHTADKP